MVVLNASRWNRRYHGWPLGTRGAPSTKDSPGLQRARLAVGDHADRRNVNDRAMLTQVIDEIWFPGQGQVTRAAVSRG
jgi:hypothetical protein